MCQKSSSGQRDPDKALVPFKPNDAAFVTAVINGICM